MLGVPLHPGEQILNLLLAEKQAIPQFADLDFGKTALLDGGLDLGPCVKR